VSVEAVTCEEGTSFGKPETECVLDTTGGPEAIDNATVTVAEDPNEPGKDVIDYDPENELPDWATSGY
jgi:hypothetical protein